MILAYVCQLTGVHDADLKGGGPQRCSSGSGGNGVRTVIVEDPPQGGRHMACQRRVLRAKF
jgi:hypothetical protein